MSVNIYNPGPEGTPYGNHNANALGSSYAANSAYAVSTTDLLQRVLFETIFDAAPAKYNILKLIMEQEFETVKGDEFFYDENTFGRSPLVASGVTAATAAVAGTTVSATYSITAASFKVSNDIVVCFNDAGNTKGIITAVLAGNQVTITSQTSQGLPAVAAGDLIVPMSTFRADGQSLFATYQRMEVIQRYNYMQGFLRARRWGKKELIKWQNLGTTNYLERDTEEVVKQVRFDVFASVFNGTRGEFRTAAGEPGKAMGGIWPTMQAAGAASATTTTAGLQATLEALAYATDYKAEGDVRFIVAVPRLIGEIQKLYKQTLTRYSPSDRIADLELDEIRFGGLRFVFVPCMLLQEPSLFPLSFANKYFVLDLEAIKPVQMAGYPAFQTGGTLQKGGENGSREDFKDFFVEGFMSIKFHNPIGSFTIDLI